MSPPAKQSMPKIPIPVLLDGFHVVGKDKGAAYLVSNPGSTESDLVRYLMTMAPNGVPPSMAEDKARHIASRLFMNLTC